MRKEIKLWEENKNSKPVVTELESKVVLKNAEDSQLDNLTHNVTKTVVCEVTEANNEIERDCDKSSDKVHDITNNTVDTSDKIVVNSDKSDGNETDDVPFEEKTEQHLIDATISTLIGSSTPSQNDFSQDNSTTAANDNDLVNDQQVISSDTIALLFDKKEEIIEEKSPVKINLKLGFQKLSNKLQVANTSVSEDINQELEVFVKEEPKKLLEEKSTIKSPETTITDDLKDIQKVPKGSKDFIEFEKEAVSVEDISKVPEQSKTFIEVSAENNVVDKEANFEEENSPLTDHQQDSREDTVKSSSKASEPLIPPNPSPEKKNQEKSIEFVPEPVVPPSKPVDDKPVLATDKEDTFEETSVDKMESSESVTEEVRLIKMVDDETVEAHDKINKIKEELCKTKVVTSRRKSEEEVVKVPSIKPFEVKPIKNALQGLQALLKMSKPSSSSSPSTTPTIKTQTTVSITNSKKDLDDFDSRRQSPASQEKSAKTVKRKSSRSRSRS